MRYFKRISKEYSGYKTGVIYPEDAKPKSPKWETIKQSLKLFPKRWKEVSEIEYIKQQGWYIKGSEEFSKWLIENKVDRRGYDGFCTVLHYEIKDNKLFTLYNINRTDKVEITIDQLNELYNIKPNKEEMEFEVGDKVLVTSWHYRDIRLPQEGVIKAINLKSNTPYYIELEEVPFNISKSWYFKKGEFELLIKQKEMENFQVNVNEVTSRILQELAFKNGWKWNITESRDISNLQSPYLNFYVDKKRITHGSNSSNKKVSLEEAISRITTKEESFKEGDYVVVTQHLHNRQGQVVQIESLISGSNNRPIRTVQLSGDTADIHSKNELRKATDKEIKSALIKEAERRGFKPGVYITNRNLGYGVKRGKVDVQDFDYYPGEDKLALNNLYIYMKGEWAEIVDEPKEIFGFKVTKTDNGSYKFGCSDHVYTFDELQRVTSTLGEICGTHTVEELYRELDDLINQ